MHDINLLAALVAGIVYYAIGALWYSPVLFVKPWMQSLGIDPNNVTPEMKAGMGKTMGGQFIVCLVIAYFLGIMLKLVGANTLHLSLLSAFWIWLAFRVTSGVTSMLFEKKKWVTFVVNQGYDLVGFLAMAAILSAWK